jgi:TolA-binding protein
MKRAIVCIAVLAVLAAALPEGEAAERKRDMIILKDGTTKEVPSVLDENFANLRYRWGSKEERMPIRDVKQVVYHDAPGEWHNAMGLFASKKYQEALAEFDTAMNTGGVRTWIQQYALFYMAECNRKLGKNNRANYRTAIEKYEELLANVPETRFLPEAMYYIGDCHTQLENYDKAVAAFRKLQTEVSKKALTQSWALEADLAEGKVLELKEDFMAAFHKYNSIHTTASRMGLPNVASKALLRKGICLIKQNKFSEAERYFQDLYKNAKGEDKETRAVKGGACIGLGRCFLKKNDMTKARYWFLKSMVLYFSSEEFHPQAMYYAGLTYDELKKSEKGAKEQAKRIFAELFRRYPKSTWARKAKSLGYK